MDALRRLFKPQSRGAINLMVERFLFVFEAHDIDVSQIPRLVPQLRYEDLESPKQLLAALTPAVIDATAQLFGVRSQWLEGLDDLVYYPFWTRKNPKAFLSLFASASVLGDRTHEFPLRVLATSMDIGLPGTIPQLLLPVIVETVGVAGDDPVHRCHVSGTYYNWADPASRIELKALAWLVYRGLKTPVPLFQVTLDELENFAGGLAIPSVVWRRGLVTDPSLEDYILSLQQSAVAKETDELPAVLSYLDEQGLSDFRFETPNSPILDVPAEETTSKDAPFATPAPDKKPSAGKRQNQKDQWAAIVGAAQAAWAYEPTVTYTAMIGRLQRMPHLKASALGDSAIRKHIRDVAPPGVRDKPGRRSKQST